MKIVLRRVEKLWEKEKLLITSKFSFSYSVSTGLLLQKHETQASFWERVNEKILDWSKFKAHAEDKINLTQNLNFVLGKVENILEKEKVLVTTNSPFPKMFSKGLFLKVCLKPGLCGKGFKNLYFCFLCRFTR